MIAVILAAALGGSTQAPTEGPPAPPQTVLENDCSVDTEAMLDMSPEDFDQSPQGWRSLQAKGDCFAETADLIAGYRERHWRTLQLYELHISYWHEGQVRALASQTELAIKLLLAGVSPQSTYGFSEYALATVAFLQNDLEALKSARARLAATPRPVEFAGAKWPPNLDVVDGLIACFGRPYREAYSATCRPT